MPFSSCARKMNNLSGNSSRRRANIGRVKPTIAEFPDKLFIFLAHEENGKPYPAIAQHIRKLSEVKCRVEGFTAYITTRFQSKEGGGEDFVIWEEGAAAYAADK